MTAQPNWFFVWPRKNRRSSKSRSYLKNQQGFTLIEILVAISLMVIALFALVGMQTVALKSNNIANQLSVATSLASEALEDISSSTWSSNGTALTNGTTTINFGSSTSGNYGQYVYQSAGIYNITCTPTLNTPITGIAQLDVSVTYTYKGNTKTVTISGYKRLL